MTRTYITQIKEHGGKEVMVKGFVHTIRDQGSIKFLLVRDKTGIVQAVVKKNAGNVFTAVEKLTTESVIELKGLVKTEPQAPGGVELEAIQLVVLSKADPELPIPVVAEKGAEDVDITKRLDWRWIDLRKPEGLLIFKTWTALEKGAREFFAENGYVQVYPPALMSTASESGSEVFKIEYFDRDAYLAQSPQFYKQAAMAAGFEKVFMVGPVFRAEPSFTTRHTTEYTGWDLEISYIESHHDVMAELQQMITAGIAKVKAELGQELETVMGVEIEVPAMPFPKITMREAKEKLAKVGIASKADFDVSPEEERELSRIVKEEQNHDFVFLIDWPIQGRPFYHMRHADNDQLTKSFDLLYKGVEIVTGSQREHRTEILEKQATDKNMPLEELEDYFNFFRYGCPPHGGIGMGPVRLIAKLLGLQSIKEATFLPRDVKRLTP